MHVTIYYAVNHRVLMAANSSNAFVLERESLVDGEWQKSDDTQNGVVAFHHSALVALASVCAAHSIKEVRVSL